MNLMVVLIPLLLSAAKFTELALLEYLPPAESADVEPAPEPSGGGSGEKTLNLVLNLIETGVQVSMYQKNDPGPFFFEIPRGGDGDYDWIALKDSLWSIKQREVGDPIGIDSLENERTQRWEKFPIYKVKDGREISITALGATKFQTITRVMDACRYIDVTGNRRELFPVTMLKQFQ